MKTIYWIIAIAVALLIGYAFGTYTTIKAVAWVGKGFVDEGMIRQAIYMYENNIGNCFPSNLTI